MFQYSSKISIEINSLILYEFVCLCVKSLLQRGQLEMAPNLLSLAKEVKLGKYTFSIGNRTTGRRVTVHYATAAPRKLHNPV